MNSIRLNFVLVTMENIVWLQDSCLKIHPYSNRNEMNHTQMHVQAYKCLNCLVLYIPAKRNERQKTMSIDV